MNPNPPKRPRRTSSPSSRSNVSQAPSLPSQSSRQDIAARAEPGHSPSKPILPAPIPSSLMGVGSGFPLPPPPNVAPRPQSWAPGWGPTGSRESPSMASGSHPSVPGPSRTRLSMERRTPSSPGSPRSPQGRMEGIDEGSEASGPPIVYARDTTANRAPRSMMACTRCRRQKMKCDGPSQVPCRGCRQSGQPCIFEARSRPKSISALPSRPPPFFAARPATPTGPGGFYPSGAQPAPPALSRPASIIASGAPIEQYGSMRGRDLRDPREPMPPPPAASINVLTSPFPPPSRNLSPPASAPSNIVHTYHPPPATSTQLAPPYPISTSAPLRPATPTQESRLRQVESTVRNLSTVPSALNAVQTSLNSLRRSFDGLSSSLQLTQPARGNIDVSESTWEDYRSRAWPLTPWLVGLRETHGLPGLVVDFLGKRAVIDRSEPARAACAEAESAVRAETGKLIAGGMDWTREEVRALGVFGTWTNDPSLSSLAVAHGRILGLDRIWTPRKTHDDWREWIYLKIMDHLSQLVDFEPPFTTEMLSSAWRDRLGSSPRVAPGEAAVRDRDLKLLAWLEYAETLSEVFHAQQSLRRESEAREDPSSSAVGLSDRRVAEAFIEIWRKYASRWEAWAGAWSVRGDPILSLHFNYAILHTTTPAALAREGVWIELAREQEGYAVLERARDAAFAVISAVCSPEVGRTLPYSFPLFRPILALAVHLILTFTSLPPTVSPLISISHIQSLLRSTYDTLHQARPPEMHASVPSSSSGSSTGAGSMNGSILSEIVVQRGGEVGVMTELRGWEMGRDAWRRIIG